MLAEKIREYRMKNGYTQEGLAQALFVSRSLVAKWESGKGMPTEEAILAMAELFHISKEELIKDPVCEEIIVKSNSRIFIRNILLAIGGAVIVVLLTLTVLSAMGAHFTRNIHQEADQPEVPITKIPTTIEESKDESFDFVVCHQDGTKTTYPFILEEAILNQRHSNFYIEFEAIRTDQFYLIRKKTNTCSFDADSYEIGLKLYDHNNKIIDSDYWNANSILRDGTFRLQYSGEDLNFEIYVRSYKLPSTVSLKKDSVNIPFTSVTEKENEILYEVELDEFTKYTLYTDDFAYTGFEYLVCICYYSGSDLSAQKDNNIYRFSSDDGSFYVTKNCKVTICLNKYSYSATDEGFYFLIVLPR